MYRMTSAATDPVARRPAPATFGGFGEFFRYHGWLSPGVRLFRSIGFKAKATWFELQVRGQAGASQVIYVRSRG